jgi:hypothetical protein
MKQSNQIIKAAFDQVDGSDYDHEGLWQAIEPSLPRETSRRRLLLWLTAIALIVTITISAVALSNSEDAEVAIVAHKRTSLQDGEVSQSTEALALSSPTTGDLSTTLRHANDNAETTAPTEKSIALDNQTDVRQSVQSVYYANASQSSSVSTGASNQQYGDQSAGSAPQAPSLINPTHTATTRGTAGVLRDGQAVAMLVKAIRPLAIVDRRIKPTNMTLLPTWSPTTTDQTPRSSVEWSLTYGLLDVNLQTTAPTATNDLLTRNMQEDPLDIISTELRYFYRILPKTEVFAGLQYSQQTTKRKTHDVSIDTTLTEVLIQRIISPSGTTEVYDERPVISTTYRDANSFNRFCAVAMPIGLRQYIGGSNRTQFFLEGELVPTLHTWQSGSVHRDGQVYDLSTDDNNILREGLQLSGRLAGGLALSLTEQASVNFTAAYWRQFTDAYEPENYALRSNAQAISFRLAYRHSF